MLLKKKVAFHTLGCKLNFTETSTIARSFVENGYELTDFSNKADFYVINTCSVTDNADKKFKNILNKANKNNPDAFKIVIGCYAQLKPESISKIQGVDLVLGANEKFNVVDYLDTLSKENTHVYSCDINKVNSYESSFSVDDRTRSFLKIQDGCDYKCTYCTIPLARGVSRSDSLENIKNNISQISSKSVKEIILTGVNIGDYGKGEFGNKKHETTFLELIKELDLTSKIDRFRISSIEPNLLKNNISQISSKSVKEIILTGVNIGDYGKGEFGNKKHETTFLELIKELDLTNKIDRFRISSIEPNLLKNDIIDFVSKSNLFVPHFHIPLQSGSNKILARMKRRYKKELYEDRINHIHSKIDNCCIGVDVIVGFPGETDSDFQDTYDFLLNLENSYLHVFTYSERDNTEAAGMNDNIPKNIRNKRSKMLRSLSEKKKRIFYNSQLNKIKPILFETENKFGYIHGYTDNYIKVRHPWSPSLSNKIIYAKLSKIDNEGFVRVEDLDKKNEKNKEYLYSNSYW